MYRPGHLSRRPPKLLRGTCTAHVLLSEAWRCVPGQSQRINVEPYAEGLLFVDVLDLGPLPNSLAVVVEVGRDTQRWADRLRWPLFDQAGYFQIPVTNVGAFLRVSYTMQAAALFGIEFLGKSFSVEGPGR